MSGIHADAGFDTDIPSTVEEEPDSFPLEASDILQEFPFRQPSAHEFGEAASTYNAHTPELASVLRTELFAPVNVCVKRPPMRIDTLPSTAWRPRHPGGAWDPALLFQDFTFTMDHGPHCIKFIPSGAASIRLSAQQIWEEICLWFETAIADVRYSCSRALGGRRKRDVVHRRRTKLWLIPREAMSQPARPVVWDRRSFWQDGSAGIHPVVSGDERRTTGLGDEGNKAGICYLQQRYQCPDQETPQRMVSGVCTFSDDAFDGIVLGPNYSGFYDEVDFAVEKNLQELAGGILQGPIPGPAFLPCRVFATNVAIQPNGKKRRTGDGGWPRDLQFAGEDISLNSAIDIEDAEKFPLYTLPSALTFGRLLAIAMSCAEFSGDSSMQMHVLLSDWVAYYRTFVLDIRYFWTQLNVFLPGGATVDTAMYFGDKGAPCVSNHAMNWLLFMWKAIFLEDVRTRTSWDVVTQSEIATFV
eukprot:SAG11_NODE_1837_length_4187_cov_4.303082_2_plen_471_part_00